MFCDSENFVENEDDENHSLQNLGNMMDRIE